MARGIYLKDQFLYVSKNRLYTLIGFALQVGGETAGSDAEKQWVEKLRQFYRQLWPRFAFDLDKEFPTVEEKRFWAQVFYDVGRRIFLRQLGNQDITSWQSSAIGDAYVIARVLARAVEFELAHWYPDTENGRILHTYRRGRFKSGL